MKQTISFVVQPLDSHRFTGGIWCVMQYAKGLAERGHEVMIVPMFPSPKPLWVEGKFSMISRPRSEQISKTAKALWRASTLGVKTALGKTSRRDLQDSIHSFTSSGCLIDWRFLPYELARGASLLYLKEILPDADITMATNFETAIPVYFYGKGKRFYFMQHFEPYFKNESSNPAVSEMEARLSYRLGLNMIANSTWLKSMVEKEAPGAEVALCPNAINHEIFHGPPKVAGHSDEIRVISYGGRDAEWKGFREMAEAMNIARRSLAGKKIRWLVYGDALLPPDNPIAQYEPLGFLNPPKLADAYRGADILLSASWYESFPLFPIEAMACGLPVITTQFGTEDYAIPGETAEVVEAKNPENIAGGLINIILNEDHRFKIATNGNKICKHFNWGSSVLNMEKTFLSDL